MQIDFQQQVGSQRRQDNMLAYDPLQVMSPNQAIQGENQMAEQFRVPELPFPQAQGHEIFSETSFRVYRELRGPKGVVLQQNNFLQQIIQDVPVALSGPSCEFHNRLGSLTAAPTS